MGYFQDDGSVATRAIQIAAQQAGKPYVWGAGGPDAFDCSGLVHYAYALAGLPGTGNPTSHQWTTFTMVFMGDPVMRGQEQPGDLILPTPGHVGICIGNGQMWDAATTGVPVQVHKYSSVYAIRRIATPSNSTAVGGITTTGFNSVISNPLQPLIDAVHSFDTVLKTLTNGHTWIRIFEVVSGSVLLYIATKVD